MPVAKINQEFLQRRRLPPGFHWDDRIKGFGVRVGKAGRPVSYVYQRSGKDRVALGKVNETPLEEARRMAHARAAAVAPAAAVRPTLREGMLAHLASMRRRDCRPSSMETLEREMLRYTGVMIDDWMDKISHAAVAGRHEELTHERGPYLANRWVRHMRAIYNTADVSWPLKKSWKPNPESRAGKEPVYDLAAFAEQIRGLSNPIMADWWRWTLITGLRRGDALTLRWEHVDRRRHGWLLVPEPKGGPRRAFELPITEPMRTILARTPRVNEWVFSGNRPGGHIVATNRTDFPAPHRLRATWATRAAELGCPIPVLKMLLNHSIKGDVTGLYITPSDDALREWAAKTASSLWEQVG